MLWDDRDAAVTFQHCVLDLASVPIRTLFARPTLLIDARLIHPILEGTTVLDNEAGDVPIVVSAQVMFWQAHYTAKRRLLLLCTGHKIRYLSEGLDFTSGETQKQQTH